MVFQTYALYPHMTVYQNMSFGLKQAKTDPKEIDIRVKEAADILQITDYLDRSPKNLSGGQRQRVAIGRAIVRDPEVFLFDEPLSNLDAALRVQTRLEIARLHERLGSTMIYVTHDQVEAMTLADKIVVLKDGYIEQVGTPMDLYERPNNSFVAQFIGSPKMNIFPNTDLPQKSKSVLSKLKDKKIDLGIRPEHLIECKEKDAIISGKLDLVENLGEYALVHMTSDNGMEFIAKLNNSPTEKKGEKLYFKANKDFVHYFDSSNGDSI
jgi:multiple sugar transport system ATP-binding protein/alpha-glucoside transport system ATP-binding protein